MGFDIWDCGWDMVNEHCFFPFSFPSDFFRSMESGQLLECYLTSYLNLQFQPLQLCNKRAHLLFFGNKRGFQ